MTKIILSLSILLGCIILASAQNSVSFDNQSGESALVKLIGPTTNEIDVPNGTKQAVQAPAGKYFIKVRYGVKGNYHYTKGQEFAVDETATTTSDITITLHKVVNGNYGSRPISEDQLGVSDPDKTTTNAFDLQETRLGLLDGKMQYPIISRDGCHLAFVTQRDQQLCVVMDGKMGAEYDSVSMAYVAIEPSSDGQSASSTHSALNFSPNGKSVSYVARKDQKDFIVVDGVTAHEYPVVGVPSGIVQFSPDGKRLAYLAKIENKKSVVIDGVAGTGYDAIGDLVFSPDSKRLAYLAASGNAEFVVVDGQVGAEYDGIDGLSFSPDSKRTAYGAKLGHKWSVIIEGKANKQHDGIGGLIFSHNSAHVAYLAKNGQKWSAVIDGKADSEFDGITSLMFSPDSKRVAYLAKTGQKWSLVVNGSAGPEHDGFGGMIFSPDGKHMAYWVQNGQKYSVAIDGVAGADYDVVGDHLIFSPDGERMAYMAKKNEKWLVVVDGSMHKEYDSANVPAGIPRFSPDGKHVAYAAKNGEKWTVVLDGTESMKYDTILQGAPMFGGDGVLEFLAVKENSLYRVKYVPRRQKL